MDRDKIGARAEHLLPPITELNTPYAIDAYADYIVSFTQNLIEQTVP
jgi:hypothetical protein